MKKYIIGVDEGTTSCRAGLFDLESGKIVKIEQEKIDIFYPQEGYVEQDGEQIFTVFLKVVKKILDSEEAKQGEIVGLSITNQRESTVCFDSKTGKCVAPVINWQCRRTAKKCDQISDNMKKYIKKKTGLVADAYFSATKMQWIFDNFKICKKLRQEKTLRFSTIESYIIFRLTGGRKFVSDVTNASRTMLFDIENLCYDEKLLKFFNINNEELPQVIENDQIIDTIELFGRKITLCGLIGDQQAALFGQACFEKGEIKNTYGTGCFMLQNTKEELVKTNKLISTIAYKLSGQDVCYAVEGSVFNCGSAIDWLKQIGLISSAEQTETLAKSVNDTLQTVFVPALTGLGAPYWDSGARGLFVGMTRATKKEHLVRAVLNSIALSVCDIFDEMKKHISDIPKIKCDGGVSKNNFLMQIQSDFANVEVLIPENHESTLLGAIYMCGVGLKVLSLDQIQKNWKLKKSFVPKQCSQKKIKQEKQLWKSAVERAKGWRWHMKAKKMKSFDGKILQTYSFECENPKAVIQIAHGMQEYSANYFDFANFLCENGYNVFLFDQRAHGKTAGLDSVGLVSGDDFLNTVKDHLFFSEKLKKKDLPLFLFSHSYGSFIAQEYLKHNPSCSKVVLMGTGYMKTPVVRLGKVVAKLTYAFFGKDAPAKMIENLSFNSYKKKFKTGSWITTSESQTEKFYADDFNGTIFSAGFYYHMFSHQLKLYKNIENINPNTKILFISGEEDVIGNNGKGVKKVYNLYKKKGKNVLIKLYKNLRHALLIEENNQKIFSFLLDFFNEKT